MADLIIPSTLRDLRTAIDTRYNQAYASVQMLSGAMTTNVSSSTRSQHFPVHSKLAKLRKWEGTRVVSGGKSYDYILTNEKYELTLGIPREDIEDDNIGYIQFAVDDIGQQMRLWQDDLVFAAMLAGGSETSYDGVSFFSDSHSLGGNTVDNLFASTALTADNVAAVRQHMQEYVGEDGRSLQVIPDLIVVPPALEYKARKILEAGTLLSTESTSFAAVDNVLKGAAKVLVVPQLSAAAGGSDTTWYALDTRRAMKPFIFQTRVPPTIVSKIGEQEDNVFWEDNYVWGVRARGVAGYGPFWLAAKCTA